MWKNSSLKDLYNKGFRGGILILIIWANFASTYTFILGKWVFFSLFSLPQNLKMALCKGYRVSKRPKKAKKNVKFITFFENWDLFKGTLRAFLGHSWRRSESLANKGFQKGKIRTQRTVPCFYILLILLFRLYHHNLVRLLRIKIYLHLFTYLTYTFIVYLWSYFRENYFP